MTLEERFWARVDRPANDGCWTWRGYRNPKGYGQIQRGARGGGTILTHRLSWQMAHGAIPDGLSVLHRCDNPPCCNPAHLFLGTRADNNADMRAKGRGKIPHYRGEKNNAAILTEEDVRLMRMAHETLPVTQADIARAWGIRKELAYDIIRRRTWRHVA